MQEMTILGSFKVLLAMAKRGSREGVTVFKVLAE